MRSDISIQDCFTVNCSMANLLQFLFVLFSFVSSVFDEVMFCVLSILYFIQCLVRTVFHDCGFIFNFGNIYSF